MIKPLFPGAQLQHRATDRAEGVANPGSQQAYHHDDNKRHQREDDRVFDKALPSFFGSE